MDSVMVYIYCRLLGIRSETLWQLLKTNQDTAICIMAEGNRFLAKYKTVITRGEWEWLHGAPKKNTLTTGQNTKSSQQK